MRRRTHARPARRRERLPQRSPAALTTVGPGAILRLQREAGNRAVLTLVSRTCGDDCACAACAAAPVVQRDRKGNKPVKEVKAGGGHQQLWIVRDRSIGLGGGTLVSDLADFKTKMMRTTDADGWTLVLAIHGSEDRLGAQAPPNWQKNAVFYDASDIDALFQQDKAFVKWRDKFGPTHLSLVSCQVSAPFESVLINSLTRPGDTGSRQPKRGLGEGCKPISSTVTFNAAPSSKARFDKLGATAKQTIIDDLSDLNKKWGYYGAPPVPDDLLLHYYYDEDPKQAWVTVEVHVDQGGHNLKATGIPYWNRTFGPDSAKFRQLCTQGIATLKGRKPQAPKAPDE
jgi:hypothetical protein